MPNSWPIQNFSLCLPEGTDRSDVPALLRTLANNLDEYGPIEVQDITFGTEVTAEGYVHSMTVYFHPADVDDEVARKEAMPSPCDAGSSGVPRGGSRGSFPRVR
jgi:hypothetical protein